MVMLVKSSYNVVVEKAIGSVEVGCAGAPEEGSTVDERHDRKRFVVRMGSFRNIDVDHKAVFVAHHRMRGEHVELKFNCCLLPKNALVTPPKKNE
jgi:hypothetical protein